MEKLKTIFWVAFLLCFLFLGLRADHQAKVALYGEPDIVGKVFAQTESPLGEAD